MPEPSSFCRRMLPSVAVMPPPWGALPLGRLLSHLRPGTALPEGEVQHQLACPFGVVRDRQPPRVVAPRLRAPVHPALPLVHGQVTLGLEGAALARVLERRPDPLARERPSAEGPSKEESKTGGGYSGRFPTSESQTKTFSGGASIVWLCSYSSCWATIRAAHVAGPTRIQGSRGALGSDAISLTKGPRKAKQAGGGLSVRCPSREHRLPEKPSARSSQNTPSMRLGE